ncbi:hypothetical protein [Stenotrophomonas maltophilia]|uniref:hypothetical protein n=1 Tax=Stenotrophomonas maltophilia TaxID=40324 RepID=UPI002155966B|nr:hypothetical protein [Stenotrophomonas maltophilia]
MPLRSGRVIRIPRFAPCLTPAAGRRTPDAEAGTLLHDPGHARPGPFSDPSRLARRFTCWTALAAGSPTYADCLLGNIQPGLSDRAVQLIQQACAAKNPESLAAAMELERRFSEQRQAEFAAAQAQAARSADAAATAAKQVADAAAAKATAVGTQ